VLLKTVSRDTERVTNFHKQCQNFAEKCQTASHRTLTDLQNHGNRGKRAKENKRRGWTSSRKVLMC